MPRLVTTFPDSQHPPDGLALAPDGRVPLSLPNLAGNQYPRSIVVLTDYGYQPFLSRLPVEPSTRHAAPMNLAFGLGGNQ